MIQSTGNSTQDLDVIVNELNRLSSSSVFTDTLQIISYGNVGFTIPNTTSINTASFPHGLDYAPIFILKVLGGDGFSRDFPFIPDTYVYSSGSKGQGAYPYNRFLTYADNKNIYIEVDNLSNPGGFIFSGHVVITYYIFNRPIVSNT